MKKKTNVIDAVELPRLLESYWDQGAIFPMVEIVPSGANLIGNDGEIILECVPVSEVYDWLRKAEKTKKRLIEKYGDDGNGLPCNILCRYRHCGEKWTEEWSCSCDSECPKCGAAIEAYSIKTRK